MHFNRAVPATILTLNERSLAAIFMIIFKFPLNYGNNYQVKDSSVIIPQVSEITNDTLSLSFLIKFLLIRYYLCSLSVRFDFKNLFDIDDDSLVK